MTELKNKILNALNTLKSGAITKKDITPYFYKEGYKNELLFFTKPELAFGDLEYTEAILDKICSIFKEFDVIVNGCRILSGTFLEKYNIISRHYGAINRASVKGASVLSVAAKVKFENIFCEPMDKVRIYGGHEFLSLFPDIDGMYLNTVWDGYNSYKLASGTYCAKIGISGKEYYIINGFHPSQIQYFTNPKSFLIVMGLQSNTNWEVLRERMVGATDPTRAEEGSIRRTLLEMKDELKLKTIDQSYNGVHLSAGPVEGLAENIRFFSNYHDATELKIEDTSMGKYFLSQGISHKELDHLMANPYMSYAEHEGYVFSLTEDIDADECVRLIKSLG